MTDIQDRTDIEYGEAPPAVDFGSLTTAPGTAPPVVQDVTYERILDARSEPQNWLTYYGAYDGQRYSPLDQITTENVVRMTPAWVFSFSPHGLHAGQSTYDLENGERVWRCYTIPKPGEPGSETWPQEGEAWARGGANGWITGTFDPETNLLYWGTGNPAPDFDGEVRPGDNIYTDSVIAVDADSGEIRWHYQCTPHDLWDYDSNMECILFEQDGRKLLAHFDKNGYCFVLDRTTGERVRIFPFVDRITWGEITPDGQVTPRIYPDKEGEEVHFYPGPAGAKEWTHASYNPRTELFYVPVQDTGARVARRRREFKEGIPYWG